MPAKEFRKLLKAEPVVAEAVIRELVRNVRTLTKRVYEFSTLALNNRIQAELLRLAGLATREGKGARINPAPIHAEIASRVSTHREAVTRELNRLSRVGIIERRRGALVVHDLDRLAAMLNEMTGETIHLFVKASRNSGLFALPSPAIFHVWSRYSDKSGALPACQKSRRHNRARWGPVQKHRPKRLGVSGPVENGISSSKAALKYMQSR